MQKKNNIFIKKLFFSLFLSLFLVFSFSSVSYAADVIEAGYYRINARSYAEYIELLDEYSTSGSVSIRLSASFYDVDGNLIIDSTDYNNEALTTYIGYSASGRNYASYFLFQDIESITWNYFAGVQTNPTLEVLDNWYYIFIPTDLTISSIGLANYNRLFNGVNNGYSQNLLVPTSLGSDLPYDHVVPDDSDIPAGTYQFNYSFNWPLTEEIELRGDMTYNNASYNILRISNNDIYLISQGTNPTTIYFRKEGLWVVESPIFTASSGLNLSEDIHNAVSSFESQVNGTRERDKGLRLEDKIYYFKSNLSYGSLNRVQFNSTFQTGSDLLQSFNSFTYDSVSNLMYYGSVSEDNIVYDNEWLYSEYKVFKYTNLITNYEAANFLAQNLDLYDIQPNYFVKGYYYFNSDILGEDLKYASDFFRFTYISNGNIFNRFEYTNVGIEPNSLLYFKTTFSFYNINTISKENLVEYTYYSPSANLPLDINYPTISENRQIYISPVYVDNATYEWLHRNGEFIYYNEEVSDFPTLIGVFPDVIVHFMANLMSFDVFGVNLFLAISSLITVLVAIWLIRKLL